MFKNILNLVLLFWLVMTTIYFYAVQDDDDFIWHRFVLVVLIGLVMCFAVAWVIYIKWKKRQP
jgi:hypothetical protein